MNGTAQVEQGQEAKENTKERLRRGRKRRATLPSGEEVTIRPPNVELHALTGGLPSKLKQIAAQGVRGVDRALQQSEEGDVELRTYLEGIICEMLLDPKFDRPTYAEKDDPAAGVKKGDQIGGDVLDDYLLPADFRWLIMVAFGETDEDGVGRRLWGREPLDRFETFREEHGCEQDCEACLRAQVRHSALAEAGL